MRDKFLPFALPDVDDAEIKEIVETINSGWITTGPKALQFGAEFAAAVGARHGVPVNSCTAAMHLALEAAGLQRGDEVITTPYTFAATAEVVRYFDARPVFVDIRAEDFNIDPNLIEAAITPRTKALIPVHIAGLPAELEAIYDLARRHNLAIVEDAAHAFPAKYKGRSIGQGFGGELAQNTLFNSPLYLLLFLCHQDHHHRRRRHDLYGRCDPGRTLPDYGLAWHQQ